VLGGAIAGKTHTATTFIYTASEERKEAAAFGMALVLAVSSMLLLFLLERLKQRSHDT
jgi:sulfate transport system permease protein